MLRKIQYGGTSSSRAQLSSMMSGKFLAYVDAKSVRPAIVKPTC